MATTKSPLTKAMQKMVAYAAKFDGDISFYEEWSLSGFSRTYRCRHTEYRAPSQWYPNGERRTQSYMILSVNIPDLSDSHPDVVKANELFETRMNVADDLYRQLRDEYLASQRIGAA